MLATPTHRRALNWRILLILLAGCAGGCTAAQYRNSAATLTQNVRGSDNGKHVVMFKAGLLVPARDIVTLEPLWRGLVGCEALNTVDGEVPDGSFYANRQPPELTPAAVAIGPCTCPPPEAPFTIKKVKIQESGRPGFIGTDATGRTFFFKLDHPDYPELGTTASIVGSRILWALGYNVPPIFLVEVSGTGDPRLDGRRAAASLFIDDVVGHFHFDWFRNRRELRGLRLASAWINDVDRVGSNTLVVNRDGVGTYYLIDFDSCLGSWQGCPRDRWRGSRPRWGLPPYPTGPNYRGPAVSPALGNLVGHFDPARWHAQISNNAFNHMTAADAAWICHKIRQLDRPHIRAIVAAAQLSDPRDADKLVILLMLRRSDILRRYDDATAGVTIDQNPTGESP